MALLAPLVVGLVLGCEPAPGPPKPTNVVLITIDTLRADALGAYGQSLPTSPTLDHLAAEGVLFEQCVASVPSTLPSHTSILTGKQPYAHGVRANAGYVLTADQVTLPEVLREYGYRTAAEIAAPVIGRRTFLNQGFESYRDLESFDVERLHLVIDGESRTFPERRGADVTRHGIAFLEEHADEPFLLWLHYFDPHVIYAAPPVYAQLVSGNPYYAEVRYVDDQIRQVVGTIERLGIQDHTLLVVTSDHGEALGQHGESTHSFFVYDSTIHVPLLFWGPGLLPEPHRVTSLVRTVDIAPTILDLLQLPPLAQIQGRSLRPLLEGRTADLELTGYGESIEPHQMFGSPVLRFVRQGAWKYIHKPLPELYDVLEDPGELHNRAGQHPERVDRLRGALRKLVAEGAESGSDAVVEVDPITRAQLQALGYAATAVNPAFEDELAALELTGPDPGGLAGDMDAFAHALRKIKRRDLESALEILRKLQDRHPTSDPVLATLADVLGHLGRDDEVTALLREAIALGSRSVELHVKLARHNAAGGDPAEAERLLREGLEIDPCSVVAWVSLSQLLHGERRYAAQIEALEAGTLRCPDATDLRNDLAYALATCPDDALRNGARALELAQAAVREAPGNPAYLDTLAVALAETGNFPGAVDHARRAVQLVEAQNMPDEVVAVFRDHLTALEAGRPVRD